MHPKISVIVPIYNGQKYLSACLDSLLRQTFTDIEIIAVNNGSTDNTVELLNKYADPRLRIVTLPINQRPSGARNVGIDKAIGDYIAFCDCDDTIPENAYETVIKALSSQSADVVIGNYVEVFEDGRIVMHNVSDIKEDYNSYLKGGALWNKVFRREILISNNIKFDSISYGEDTLFLAEVMKTKCRFIQITDVLYEYLHHDDNKTALTKHFTAEHIKSQVNSKTKYFSILNSLDLPHVSDRPINAACYIYNLWRQIPDPTEKKLAYAQVQKFVSLHHMENRRAFANCFRTTPEVFAEMPFEEYEALLLTYEKTYQFKVSVIIPIYNTEMYLSETVESIIAQTLGFLENIQIILVNNATEDGAGEICEDYQNKYPENIKYIVLNENRGPSGARNAGIEFIEGKYVLFLDSDDILGTNVLQKQYAFLEQHYSEIDSASCRIRVFDAQDAWHTLDYKFIGASRVINIFYDFDYTQLSISSTLIKSSVAKAFLFDESLRIGEDAKYINEIILHKGAYGLITDAVFYYRKRSVKTSLIQTQWENDAYYFEAPYKFFIFFIDLSRELFGKVIPYVQYMLMYDLEWRFKKELPKSLSDAQRQRYIDILQQILKDIDDSIIFKQKYLSIEEKWYILTVKYGEEQWDKLKAQKNRFTYKNIEIFKSDKEENFIVNRIEIEKGFLHIDGRCSILLRRDDYQIAAKTQNERIYYADMFPLSTQFDKVSLGNIIHTSQGFKIIVPLTEVSRIDFVMIMKSGVQLPLRVTTGQFSNLNRKLPEAYYQKDGWFVKVHNNGLETGSCSRKQLIKKEVKYDLALLKRGYKRVVLLRIVSFLIKLTHLCRKKIWVCFDRVATCKDNGEFFFRFVAARKDKDIVPFFVISKDSIEYRRMKKYGKVVAFRSPKYYLLLSLADCFITSYYDEFLVKPFGRFQSVLGDICNYKHIYLQHGVIKDDMSKYHNYYNQNIKMFAVSSKREYDSILSAPYGFDKSLRLTGLARYDILSSISQKHTDKVILIAPTWRKGLVQGNIDFATGHHPDIVGFKQTDFYQFFNSFINDSRILNCMRKHGYRGELRLHPAMEQQKLDFEFNDIFTFQPIDTDFEKRVTDTSLLVTDYSSIAFDYAYVNKPIIYTQLWPEEFYSEQTNKPSYFDYRNDGFGPVCDSYETAVQTIITYIEQGCNIEPLYKERANRFFAYQDQENCMRIYNAIKELN